MKKKFKSLICILLGVFVLLTTLNVKADSGWDSSYDSGGSSYSSSSHSSSRGGRASELWYVTFIIGIVIVVILIGKDSENSTTTNYHYDDISLEDLQKYLPDKTFEQLKEDIFDCFVNIQDAWMNFDYGILKETCTDELYNTYVSQLETLKLKNRQNIMYDYQNLDMKITNITSENNVVSLTVYAKIRFYDYVINTKNDKVTRGSKDSLLTNHYLMTFVIKKGNAKSLNNCPSCGAPFNHNTSGTCEYCGSTIIKESDALVLSKKTTINR